MPIVPRTTEMTGPAVALLLLALGAPARAGLLGAGAGAAVSLVTRPRVARLRPRQLPRLPQQGRGHRPRGRVPAVRRVLHRVRVLPSQGELGYWARAEVPPPADIP